MIICLAGQKGGSGKTTTSINIVAELKARGHSVLLVDADPQMSSATWADLAAELDANAPVVLTGLGEDMYEDDKLPAYAEGFDYVVVDTPGRLSPIHRAAIMSADLVIVPCGASTLEAWALAETLDIIELAQSLRPEIESRILITRKQSRTVIGQEVRELLEQTGHAVLDAELGYRIAYQEAPAAGLGVCAYTDRKAKREIRALVDEVLALEAALRRGEEDVA